ncbi:SulP family inorganic anion transporter [Acidithiobacillus sp. VAN18-1]|uniref:SulP family inorganic anion transporter n=1 Tax=Igneacidithiobacillus copahuensis TaxID=2724909 RepID=A0AAE3CIT6_9PROT|nr:SulP family inorganic anion transporter [Igneacidithiobacillus copahuensis]MBU2787024.1 SulP family inorganic anion transporter [Igneacidithiobacillus copahuensis]MBU2796855.1 SulP family inorganic anion transporter [Acidithiobacillus sp. VAN18-2]
MASSPLSSSPSGAVVCPLWLYRLLPFLRWWPQVNNRSLRADIIAGLTGALIVLPQGVAFAVIAGLPPHYGIYAAIVPAIIAALWGSSWHLVSGPTTAISIAVYESIVTHATPGSPAFISLALTLTFLVGVFQLVLGLARMGALVNFISHTVIIGFTAGAAILIAGSQIRHFFGLPLPRGLPIHETIHQLFVHWHEINPYVTSIAVITLLAGILFKRFLPRIPYMIAAMIVGSLLSLALNAKFGAATTGIKTVGALPGNLPPLSLPDFSLTALRDMFFPALVVTMLALTEAVSIARSVATRSGQRIDGNQEFMGQGLSNFIGSFFSAYASSGSFNRSGVNYAAGARTPLATVFASGFLLLILLLVGPLAAYLPTAAMAGILFLVAWGLIDFHHIGVIWRASRIESLILWVTLLGTVINLEKGIFFGILLSLIFYLYRTSRPNVQAQVPDPDPGTYHYISAQNHAECPQLKILRVNGSLFFGAVDHVGQQFSAVDEHNPSQKHLLVMASGINFVDIAGGELLAQEARRRRQMGGGLYFYRLKEGVRESLAQGGYLEELGEENFFPAGTRPIEKIYPKLDPEICRSCTARIFPQCQSHLPNGETRSPGS